MSKKVIRKDAEWRQQLSGEQFKICRQKGTEPAFSGAYWDNKEKGVYLCVCCDNALFNSDSKFDSGTGWPSFYEAVGPKQVDSIEDGSLFMKRTEVLCSQCGSHLGHVFPDGPQPTGLRFCINSTSLKLKKEINQTG